jgi:hypothetical protein
MPETERSRVDVIEERWSKARNRFKVLVGGKQLPGYFRIEQAYAIQQIVRRYGMAEFDAGLDLGRRLYRGK